MSDDEYYAFCLANPNLRIERSSRGEIIRSPAAGFEASCRSASVFYQLARWARRDKRGRAADSSAEFLLPTGAAFSPDASWVSKTKLAQFSREELRKFPRLCPEFIVEVMSPSDRLNAAKRKMSGWMAAGAELGWLVDGDRKTVYIYRRGAAEPEKRKGIAKLDGEGPVPASRSTSRKSGLASDATYGPLRGTT